MSIAKQIRKRRTQKEYKLLQKQYRHHEHPQRFGWDWKDTNFNRAALVNMLVCLRGGVSCNYLEIGCAENDLFDSVFSSRKTGVDPARGGTHRLTSDDFFAENKDKFDVIFIDGLHEYEQVRKDAVNALHALNQNGWIAFHDLLPRSWKEHHVPRLQDAWTGDCWKLAFELAESADLDFIILNIDHGVGVLRSKYENVDIVDMRNELQDKQYDYFVDNLEKLPRLDWVDGVKWIHRFG